MAADMNVPLVGSVLKEPEWQKVSRFRVARQQPTFQSNRNEKWQWPAAADKRIEEFDHSLFGEMKKQKNKKGEEVMMAKCDICVKYREPEKFHPLRGCLHKPYCIKCVGRNAREELHGKGKINMKCPFLGCQVMYEPDDIQRTCSRNDYDRFCTFSTNKMLETLDDFRHCTNTHNGCGSGQLHDPGEDGSYNIVKCHSCGWSTCFHHKEQMHFGLTCEEYDAWKDASQVLARLGSQGDEEELTKALLAQKSRKCPECRILISKVGVFKEDSEAEACHHMSCPCGTEFCWLCGGLFYGGDPTKRKRVRYCSDAKHMVDLKGHDGTLLHCHHKEGCARA